MTAGELRDVLLKIEADSEVLIGRRNEQGEMCAAEIRFVHNIYDSDAGEEKCILEFKELSRNQAD